MTEGWNAFQHGDAIHVAWNEIKMHDSGARHVVPLGDTMAHELNLGCSCSPTSKTYEEDGQPVLKIIHNAYDGRSPYSE